MDIERNKPGNPKQHMAEGAENIKAAAHGAKERGAEAYEKAEQVATDAYEKASHAVGETYHHAKDFSHENPGKTILIALGIGVGLGFLLGATSARRSRSSRYALPVVNALSDIATEVFR